MNRAVAISIIRARRGYSRVSSIMTGPQQIVGYYRGQTGRYAFRDSNTWHSTQLVVFSCSESATVNRWHSCSEGRL